jgi:hypothetical protein
VGGRHRRRGRAVVAGRNMTAHSGTGASATPVASTDKEASANPWYKGRAWLVSAALVVVVAITVFTDLPQHSTRSGQISDAARVMAQVNSDVGPCSNALGESLTIYNDLSAHTLTPSEVNQVPGRLRDDQAACSFTDDSIYQLSTVDVPGSASGKYMGQVVSTVTWWAAADALAAIEEIQAVDSSPADVKATTRLEHFERLLASERAQAESELGAADSLLQTRLPALHLTQTPSSNSSPAEARS